MKAFQYYYDSQLTPVIRPSYIPNGTWPEERLIDGAVGAIEDPSNFTNVEDGAESALDFNSAIPLIYPQGIVLFQEDDQWYESHGGYNGFWNSTSLNSHK